MIEKAIVIETSIETEIGQARKFIVLEDQDCLRVFAEDLYELEIVSKYSLNTENIIGMGLIKTYGNIGIAISGVSYCEYKRVDEETLKLIKEKLEESYPQKHVTIVHL